MKILFIEVPSRIRNNAPPFGILYAAGAVLRCKHKAKIVNYSNDKFSFPSLAKVIREYKPDLIGLGGITPSYNNLKQYTLFLKANYPKLPIIVGGVISSISDLLLTRAKVDMVVHCEAEIAIPFIIRYYQGEVSITEIPGISYLRDGTVLKNENISQLTSLEDISFPPYELLDMSKYLCSTKKWIDFYFKYNSEEKVKIIEKLQKAPYMFEITTTRGCTHKCIFCYRHMRGIRQHSVNYVIEHIKYMQNKYGVGFFKFNDELTTSNRKWIFDFCQALEKAKLNINFVILSARVDNVDEDMLRRLKEVGCVMINYGYESGSDLILQEIKKGTNREQNINAALLTKKVGIKNMPEIMVGFPSENNETINETIDFLRIIDRYPFSLNYVLPFPQTPLWQYCLDKGLIVNEEQFILNYQDAFYFQINLTEFPDEVVQSWLGKMWHEAAREHFLKNNDYYRLIKLMLRKIVFKEKLWSRMGAIKNRLLQNLNKV